MAIFICREIASSLRSSQRHILLPVIASHRRWRGSLICQEIVSSLRSSQRRVSSFVIASTQGVAITSARRLLRRFAMTIKGNNEIYNYN
ncbi:MAG: hypothetical protein N2748_03135 [candidate division WOR-3 bacterium]|nr:hypothetical protein [candidate division WOR-3 bacterium]